MAYLEELLPEFRKGAKIRLNSWPEDKYIYQKDGEIKENRVLSFCATFSDS